MSLVEELAEGPRAFLSKYVVVVDEEGVISHAKFSEWRASGCAKELETKAFPSAGVHRFILVKAFQNVVLLRPDDGKSGASMKAHWLPWKSGEATSLDVDADAAPLFFTSELTGCRLSALPDAKNPKKAKVAHLAGNMPRGGFDRDRAEQKLFPGDKRNSVDQRTRRMSISSHDHYTNSTSSFVIGYTTSSGWKFAAQVVTGQMTAADISTDKAVPIVAPMVRVLN